MRRLEWAEHITLLGILDTLALLLGPEVIRFAIRLHIKEIVLVTPKPQ